MDDVPTIPVDEDVAKATQKLAEGQDDIHLLRVSPPEQSDGMDAAPELLSDTLHMYETERSGLFGTKNASPVCGMELWYSNQQSQFVFYTPNDSVEEHYRQQVSGYYSGCDIDGLTANEGKFIRAYNDKDEDEAIAVTRMQLNKHYFMPVSSPDGDENELYSDPYKRILNQIDTKDDTRAMIQVLFKPAPYDWTDNNSTNLETYASQIQNKGGIKTRYFGMKIDEVEDTGIWENAAAEMRSRINQPAFFVNVRIAVIAKESAGQSAEQKATARMNSLTNVFKNVYQTRAEQGFKKKTFKVNEERNAKEILTNMIERNPVHMSQPSSLSTFLWRKLTSNYNTIAMTASELAGLVHLPSSDAVTTGSVSWEDPAVTGTVPPDSEDFEPVDKEERERLIEEGEVPEINKEDITGVDEDEEDTKEQETQEKDSDDATSVLFED